MQNENKWILNSEGNPFSLEQVAIIYSNGEEFFSLRTSPLWEVNGTTWISTVSQILYHYKEFSYIC